jgi:dihydroorotase
LAEKGDLMRILLKGGSLYCASTGLNSVADLLVDGGVIEKIGEDLSADGATLVDCKGFVVTSAFVELQAHMGEPGQNWREDFETGSRAAAAGGYTWVAASPSGEPCVDDPAVASSFLERSRDLSCITVVPAGALTVGTKGEGLSEVGLLAKAGVALFTDSGNLLKNTTVLRNALLYTGKMGLPILLRAGDASLEARGAMHEGDISNRIGIRGLPSSAEEMGLAKIIALVRDTGSAVHVTGISAKESVSLLRRAIDDGLPITGSTPSFNVALIDSAVMESRYNTNLRLLPPLRGESDRAALVTAVKDGILSVSSAHTPWSRVEKELEFELAVPGATGLETAFSATLSGTGDLFATVRAMSKAPADVVGLNRRLAVGSQAEIVVLDPVSTWTVDEESFESKSRNNPFIGMELPGSIVMTIHAGEVVYSNSSTED